MGSNAKKRTLIYVLLTVFTIVAVTGVALLAQIYLMQSGSLKKYELQLEKLEKQIASKEKKNEELKTRRQEIVAEMSAQKKAAREKEESEENEEPSPEEAGGPAGTEGMADLKDQIQLLLGEKQGTWSVYVKNLASQEYLSYQNAGLKAASLIKLYIMGAIYDAVERGRLEMTDDIHYYLEQMITVSHNESANELVRRLSSTGDNFDEGMAVVNAFIRANGYKDTSQGRDLRDFRDEPAPGENYTSVEDCGTFLERVYDHTNVSESASEEMLNYLKAQTRTGKIPAGLPEGVASANKTGELSDTENDTAIVYGNGGADYILCVMSQDLQDTADARNTIVELSSMVYNYLEAQ